MSNGWRFIIIWRNLKLSINYNIIFNPRNRYFCHCNYTIYKMFISKKKGKQNETKIDFNVYTK